MSNLKVVKSDRKATLAGYLDENSDLSALKGASGELEINWKSLERVNSCGVREWVNLLKELTGASIIYEECTLSIVRQLNAVPAFMGPAKVKNFYAPYFCKQCDEEKVCLVDSSEVKGGAAPEKKCESCGATLAFDELPEQYLAFLKAA